MIFGRLASVCLGAVLAVGSICPVDPARSAEVPLWTEEAGRAGAPSGYVAFCREMPAECGARGPTAAEALTRNHWEHLVATNTLVNLLISPLSDLDQYDKEEVWTLPGSAGDCEDYVLLKRKWLIEKGWPTAALLITVVYDEIGEGHAVLVARTDRGDLVLDNKTDEILPWSATPYRFVKRQSVSDPNRWVSVSPVPASDAPTAAPGLGRWLRGSFD